jgi:hypothetical protein
VSVTRTVRTNRNKRNNGPRHAARGVARVGMGCLARSPALLANAKPLHACSSGACQKYTEGFSEQKNHCFSFLGRSIVHAASESQSPLRPRRRAPAGPVKKDVRRSPCRLADAPEPIRFFRLQAQYVFHLPKILLRALYCRSSLRTYLQLPWGRSCRRR